MRQYMFWVNTIHKTQDISSCALLFYCGKMTKEFFSHLTTVEKQRTARDVLCFMYCVNPEHILSHLPDAQKELDDWMTNVK